MPADLIPPPQRLWHTAPDRVESDWPGAVLPEALVAHLNLRGEAELHWQDGTQTMLPPRTICWLRAGAADLRLARRLASRERHECLTLVFPDAWLRQTLAGLDSEVGEAFRPLVLGHARALLRLPLSEEDEGWARGAMQPQLCLQARQLLETARLTEYLIQALFRPAAIAGPEAVSRTLRTSQERVRKVKQALLEHLEAPPSLDELAVIAGCAASHLSRTFTQVEGLTLSNWLRRARIEKAASLIATGRCNVSEAALEVGYQSFSHFSRAFAEEKGVPPSQWVRAQSEWRFS
ncbi:MAG: helix-turn-helix transcriptional regulator [Verrucomicrobiaceae bacterium]|jgi:AraC-like DNA-binding protein|nr:helix-turn-helix transcriptional regulator [Verrucomicrobiaceae bacterium]